MKLTDSEKINEIPILYDEYLDIKSLDDVNIKECFVSFQEKQAAHPDKLEQDCFPVTEFICKEEHKNYHFKVKINYREISVNAQVGILYRKKEGSYTIVGRFMFQGNLSYDNKNVAEATQSLGLSLSYPLPEPIISDIPIQVLAWEKENTWYEKYHGKKKIKKACKHLSMVFNNQSSLYLLYKAKHNNTFFMSIFELTQAKMIGPFPLQLNSSDFSSLNFHEKAIGTNATGTDSPETQVMWYLSHSKGVTRIRVDNLKTRPDSQANEVYTNLMVGRETTLTKFGNYHFLSCGLLNGTKVNAVSSNGEQPRPSWFHWISYAYRNHPITEYTDSMYSIGGVVSPTPTGTLFVEYKKADLLVEHAAFKNTSGINFGFSQCYEQLTIPSSIDQPNFNTDNFCSTVVKNKIFIFPKELFKSKNSFYIFNTDKKEFSQHKVPDHIVDKVKKGELSNYDDIVVANAESTLFLALTKSTSSMLHTQLIGLYTESLDK